MSDREMMVRSGFFILVFICIYKTSKDIPLFSSSPFIIAFCVTALAMQAIPREVFLAISSLYGAFGISLVVTVLMLLALAWRKKARREVRGILSDDEE